MKPYIHKVKYYECDRMGITHHSNYVRFMEEARVDFLEQLGYGFEKIEEQGFVSPVIDLSVNYKHPTTFPDEISIEVLIDRLTSLKIVFKYVMKVADKTVCTANSTHCFLRDGRPVMIETAFPDLFSTISKQISSDPVIIQK